MSQTAPRAHRRDTSPHVDAPVGSRMLLRLGLPSDSADIGEVNAELAGLSHYEFLLLKLPPLPGLRTRLMPGTTLTIRFIHNGEACVYRGELISHVSKPSLMIFASYPSTMDVLPLRDHRRTVCTLPVMATSRFGDFKGVVCDISMGGCQAVFDSKNNPAIRQIKADEPITLQMTLGPESSNMRVLCTVRSVNSEKFRLTMGLAFENPEDSFLTSLTSFLDSAQILSV